MDTGGKECCEWTKVYVIRHKVMVEGRSIRSVARELGISRNTVTRYLKQSEPVRKESAPRPRPVTDKVAPRIEEILEEWKHRVTPKQRLTGSRIPRQLLEEHYQVGITTVRDYLREKRRQSAEVYIPLVYRPGDEGQFDFFDVTVEEKGEFRHVLEAGPASPLLRARLPVILRLVRSAGLPRWPRAGGGAFWRSAAAHSVR